MIVAKIVYTSRAAGRPRAEIFLQKDGKWCCDDEDLLMLLNYRCDDESTERRLEQAATMLGFTGDVEVQYPELEQSKPDWLKER